MYFTNEVCKAMRPMDGCSFDNIRGQYGRSWPVDETVSGQETYVYKIRQITDGRRQADAEKIAVPRFAEQE